MIRLLDWHSLTRNAKQLNWPKSVYLHKLVLVNVSSAIVIVAGFLPSTSRTDVQSTNTGSGSGIILIGMPWAFLAVLLLPAGAPAPIRHFLLGKARELSPLPFLTQMLIEGNCPHHQEAARISFAMSLKSASLPGISCLVDSYYGTRVRYPPLQGIYIEPFSTEVRAAQGWIPRALINTNSVISVLFKKSLHNMPREDNFL